MLKCSTIGVDDVINRYSPLRFADASTDFVAEAARATPVERWLLQLLVAKHAESVGASPFAGEAAVATPTHRMALVGNFTAQNAIVGGSFSGGAARTLKICPGLLSVADDHPYAKRMHLVSVAVARAVAPPILPTVYGDRAAAYAFETEPRRVVRGGQ